MKKYEVPNLGTFMNYEYDVDLSSDTAAARVIAMTGKNKKVLEIGAGSGSITRHLRNTNDCEVSAVELNPDSVKKLMPFCNHVYSADLNTPSWVETLSKEGKFDVVIAADVLEHLYNPWQVLKQMTELLNPGGSVILSLPHVGHSALVGRIVQEDFEYREWGLLDKTHIRFFGVKNVQALIESAEMAIEECHFVIRRPNETEFGESWRKLPLALRAALARNPFGDVYQIVTRSVLSPHGVHRLNLTDVPVSAVSKSTTKAKGLWHRLGLKG